MVGPFERRNSLLKTLLFAIVGGVLVGFFELWVWFPSLTSIEASVGAGIAFALVLSVVNHFYGVESGFKMATLMSVAAGVTWWLIDRPIVHVAVASASGAIFALLIGWSEGWYKKRQRNQYMDHSNNISN